jgi:hypothetical protein
MVLADDGVDLPITNAGLFCDGGGAFINAGTVSDLPALVL